MTRPVFGDTKTIERLDPRRAILIDGISVPRDVLVCRFCGADLFAGFDDYWTSEREWGAGMIRLDCSSEPDSESRFWDRWMDGHEYDNQSDQMEDEAKVAAWLSTIHPGFKNEC